VLIGVERRLADAHLALALADRAPKSSEGRPTSATLTAGLPRRLRDRLPGREVERFGMGPAVVLGQDLSKVAGPVRDGAVADLAVGDWKLGNGHRKAAGR
jgi:hypothetical protein